MRALISVSDKTGLEDFARKLENEVFKRIFDGFFDIIVLNLCGNGIDVGGVALIRADVKANLLVVCRREDYDFVVDALIKGEDVRKRLHVKAFEYLLENDRKMLERLKIN